MIFRVVDHPALAAISHLHVSKGRAANVFGIRGRDGLRELRAAGHPMGIIYMSPLGLISNHKYRAERQYL